VQKLSICGGSVVELIPFGVLEYLVVGPSLVHALNLKGDIADQLRAATLRMWWERDADTRPTV
jgi:hypothetical protein